MSYEKLYFSGADRYLLRHETADEWLYKKLHSENMAKQIRADIMKTMPVPATGNDDGVHITQEQFDNMSYREQLELFEKHPSTYEKLTKR